MAQTRFFIFESAKEVHAYLLHPSWRDILLLNYQLHIAIIIHSYICIYIHTQLYTFIHSYTFIYIHSYTYTYLSLLILLNYMIARSPEPGARLYAPGLRYNLYYTILFISFIYFCLYLLYYTILYYTILYYTILDQTILYYTILYYTIT